MIDPTFTSTSQQGRTLSDQRARQTRDDGTMTVYGGAQEVELDAAGKVASVKTYWPMGLGLEIDKANASATELHWLHHDRLGSPVAISGDTGMVQEQLAYDAWGKRRMPDGSATPDNLDGVIDNKGYTGHEMLDQLDLVHMNGRVYDPLVAKFMSGDTLIQDPTNGQNYNRYSYVLNNPTNATDPTGFACADGSESTACHGMSTGAQITSDTSTLTSLQSTLRNIARATVAAFTKTETAKGAANPGSGKEVPATGTASANDNGRPQAGGNNQQATPACPSEMQCVTVSAPRPAPTKVFLVYTPTAGGSTTFGYHMFVKVVGEDRAPFYIRAGPSPRRHDEPSMSRVTGDATGTIDRNKQAGYGNIHVDFGEVARRADANDQLFQQYVGNVDMTVSQAAAALTSFGNAVNAAQIPYIPTSQNSNAFATQAVQSLGLPRPIPGATAVGNDTVLPVPLPQR